MHQPQDKLSKKESYLPLADNINIIPSEEGAMVVEALKKINAMSKEEFLQECIRAGYLPENNPVEQNFL